MLQAHRTPQAQDHSAEKIGKFNFKRLPSCNVVSTKTEQNKTKKSNEFQT